MAHETPVVTPSDLRDILGFTTALARRAGALILEGSRAIHAPEAKDVGEKKNSVDLVTEYDVKVEELVRREIQQTYPDFKFIGEESYVAGQNELTDDPTFCVDPIDGTTNFVHGFPFVCISIGLIYHKRPALGVIYNPFLDQLYTGIRGQGSHLHTSSGTLKLPLSPPRPLPSLSQALIAIEWGSDRTLPVLGAKADSFLKLAGDPSPDASKGGKGAAVQGGRMAHSLRSVGSAALNFALVAQGGLDVYWPWDICAGTVIAQEAGCLVSGSSKCAHTGDVAEEILTGRKYIVVRAIADTEKEKGSDAQRRLIREFYETVAEPDPL
ncbi:inositol monophosphatase [Gloeophyllum trabeum ATCC 11539]|uniref:Inositol-1-monophosphatase n=1 Tax=Gloeophyllum trabeum (strain ATCC 11539 / FP-39264 / Madison 617) TaxID=670483 RepID=S7QL68_GLOTA|nr:inositol monophosphatase [Gloeophyllum trabeum ATCC 11539]EPQ60027.1 inositol monophosphatase [Gloeophyllum trabeum ATCC 11539]